MSSASSAVTYTSVYTDSEPGRVFWGADEELSDGGSPWDPEEYEDDEAEDGPVDYPMDGGDDGDDDDDDGNSSGYDADDENEDEEEEEEDLASADSVIVIPIDELVSPPEGTEPTIPPPSTDTTTIGARITIRPQTSISLPPEAESLLAMPTPPPSPLTSLSTPSVGERLARCTAPSALPLPPLLPSSYPPPPVHRRDGRTRISQRVAMDSQRVDLLMGDRMTLQETTEMVGLRETSRVRQSQIVETLRVMRDMRRETGDMQAKLLALHGQPRSAGQPGGYVRVPNHQDAPRDADMKAMIDQALLRNFTNGDGSQSSHEDNPRHVQTTRPCFYIDFIKCHPLNFKENEGIAGLTRWIKKMESVFNISGCAIENQVKFATCTLLDAAFSWWNSQIRTLGPEAYAMTWEVLKKKMTDKYCLQGEVKKLEIELWNLKPACRPSLVSCLSLLGESLLFVTVAHGQSLGVLPSLSAVSESGSNVTAVVSGSVYSATVDV
nr:reverse transcriptase domain-containing protein [Tanacetum cinerariifolium]